MNAKADIQLEGRYWLDWLREQAKALGFSHIAVANTDLQHTEAALQAWLQAGFAGEMHYLQRHAKLRSNPQLLVKGTKSIISVRMDYLPQTSPANWQAQELARLQQPEQAVVSLYARGRDYHKVLRQRLQRLAQRLNTAWRAATQNPVSEAPLSRQTFPSSPVAPPAALSDAFAWRVFSDSAPVLEVELAQKSGLAWRGKHTLALSRESGSMFFLGEIFCSLSLPSTPVITAHCGSCNACISVCPTGAIIAPRRLDARRCISYLTIEHRGSIAPSLRPLMGNRVYGCDDCQLVCPWNRFAKTTSLPDFVARKAFVGQTLLHYFSWSETQFLEYTQGSAIRRIGHAQWLRNVAIALGNLLRHNADSQVQTQVRQALAQKNTHPNTMVREHVQWALQQIPGGAQTSHNAQT